LVVPIVKECSGNHPNVGVLEIGSAIVKNEARVTSSAVGIEIVKHGAISLNSMGGS
jgi:hypothetical protein